MTVYSSGVRVLQLQRCNASNNTLFQSSVRHITQQSASCFTPLLPTASQTTIQNQRDEQCRPDYYWEIGEKRRALNIDCLAGYDQWHFGHDDWPELPPPAVSGESGTGRQVDNVGEMTDRPTDRPAKISVETGHRRNNGKIESQSSSSARGQPGPDQYCKPSIRQRVRGSREEFCLY